MSSRSKEDHPRKPEGQSFGHRQAGGCGGSGDRSAGQQPEQDTAEVPEVQESKSAKLSL